MAVTFPEQNVFFIGEWRVSPTEGVLRRNNEDIHLEPKVAEVLTYLAAHAGEVVTREELEREVWHGALIGYDSVTNTVIKLRRALHDNPRRPRFISTIPKRGTGRNQGNRNRTELRGRLRPARTNR